MIGVASIVVMVSLGLGLSRSMMAEYESYGSLTQIQVNEPWDSENAEDKRLDDTLIQSLESAGACGIRPADPGGVCAGQVWEL